MNEQIAKYSLWHQIRKLANRSPERPVQGKAPIVSIALYNDTGNEGYPGYKGRQKLELNNQNFSFETLVDVVVIKNKVEISFAKSTGSALITHFGVFINDLRISHQELTAPLGTAGNPQVWPVFDPGDLTIEVTRDLKF